MNMNNPYKGRTKKPLASKCGGGAVLRESGKGGPGHKSASRGNYDVSDPWLRGQGSPYSSAYKPPSKKGR